MATTKKLNAPLDCPLRLSLKNESMHQLKAVINHIGENLSSGHYNILLASKQNNQFILADDLDISSKSNANNMNKISYVVVYERQ